MINKYVVNTVRGHNNVYFIHLDPKLKWEIQYVCETELVEKILMINQFHTIELTTMEVREDNSKISN